MSITGEIVSFENQIKVAIFDSDVPKQFIKYLVQPSKEYENKIHCKIIYFKGKKEVTIFERDTSYLSSMDLKDITKILKAVHFANTQNKYIDFQKYTHEWETNLNEEDSYISFELKNNKKIKIIPELNLIVAKRNFTLTILDEDIKKTVFHKVKFSPTNIDEKISEIKNLLSEPLSNFIEIKENI